MSYGHDRAFSDRFIPEIRRIIGPYLLVPASLEQDRHLATDLVLLRARDLMIGCRVRRPGYENFWHQFTIRLARENGAKTELRKFIEGFGDWFFYGHAATDEHSITRWMLLDLAAWRAHLLLRSPIRWGDQRNGDGATAFRWFDVKSFPPDPPLVIAEFTPDLDDIPW
jgi:hypothetical protein